jgi:hypothetical protein
MDPSIGCSVVNPDSSLGLWLRVVDDGIQAIQRRTLFNIHFRMYCIEKAIYNSFGKVIRKLAIPLVSLPFAITTFAGTSY